MRGPWFARLAVCFVGSVPLGMSAFCAHLTAGVDVKQLSIWTPRALARSRRSPVSDADQLTLELRKPAKHGEAPHHIQKRSWPSEQRSQRSNSHRLSIGGLAGSSPRAAFPKAGFTTRALAICPFRAPAPTLRCWRWPVSTTGCTRPESRRPDRVATLRNRVGSPRGSGRARRRNPQAIDDRRLLRDIFRRSAQRVGRAAHRRELGRGEIRSAQIAADRARPLRPLHRACSSFCVVTSAKTRAGPGHSSLRSQRTVPTTASIWRSRSAR